MQLFISLINVRMLSLPMATGKVCCQVLRGTRGRGHPSRVPSAWQQPTRPSCCAHGYLVGQDSCQPPALPLGLGHSAWAGHEAQHLGVGAASAGGSRCCLSTCRTTRRFGGTPQTPRASEGWLLPSHLLCGPSRTSQPQPLPRFPCALLGPGPPVLFQPLYPGASPDSR